MPWSPTGRAVIVVALVGLSALWVSAWTAIVLLAVVVAAFVGEAIVIRRPPAVVRTVPREVVRGVPVPFSIEVEHRPTFAVRVRQPQTADLRLDPAEATRPGPSAPG